MTTADFSTRTGRAVPTQVERRTAARIRVSADKKLGRTTPKWIETLAKPSHVKRSKKA